VGRVGGKGSQDQQRIRQPGERHQACTEPCVVAGHAQKRNAHAQKRCLTPGMPLWCRAQRAVFKGRAAVVRCYSDTALYQIGRLPSRPADQWLFKEIQQHLR